MLSDVLPVLLGAEVAAIREAAQNLGSTTGGTAGGTGGGADSVAGQTGSAACQTGGTVSQTGGASAAAGVDALRSRLSHLGQQPVTVELLAAGGLGKEVRGLKKIGCVAEAAGRVVDAWKAQLTNKKG